MPEQQDYNTNRKRIRLWVIIVGLGLFVAVCVVIPFYFVSRGLSQAENLAEQAAEGIRQTFNLTPRVTVNGLTVVQETVSIRELALLRQTIFKEYTWTHSFLGSTKTLVLRGEFVVKAGYNLKEPWSLHIHEAPLLVEVQLPYPVILSVEMTQYSVVKDENGWWNAISARDREQAVAALRTEVHRTIQELRLLEKVEKEAIQSITELIRQKSNGSINNIVYKPLPQ